MIMHNGLRVYASTCLCVYVSMVYGSMGLEKSLFGFHSLRSTLNAFSNQSASLQKGGHLRIPSPELLVEVLRLFGPSFLEDVSAE
jgi:hypothetical protein